MKHLILIGALLSSPAISQVTETCKQVEESASVTMQARQSGIPLSRVLEIAADSEMLKTIAIDAYNTPKFATESYKVNAISEFTNKWLLACLKYES